MVNKTATCTTDWGRQFRTLDPASTPTTQASAAQHFPSFALNGPGRRWLTLFAVFASATALARASLAAHGRPLQAGEQPRNVSCESMQTNGETNLLFPVSHWRSSYPCHGAHVRGTFCQRSPNFNIIQWQSVVCVGFCENAN